MEFDMLYYYFLKSLEKEIPSQIKSKLLIDNTFRYASSSFLNLGKYYKVLNLWKSDKYNISNKLHIEENFFNYIYDCMIYAKYKNDYRYLYFIYGNIASFSIDKFLIPYINSISKNKNDFYKKANMIDYYYTYKEDKIDLFKIKITNMFDFNNIYNEEIHNFVNRPIEKNIKFFACKNYFLHSAKIKYHIKYYFSKHSIYYFVVYLIDLFKINRNKKKLRHFKYSKKIDTSILNLNHNEIIVNDEKKSYSFDDYINLSYEYSKKLIEAINNYIFLGNIKEFKNITGINVIEDNKNVKNNEDK